MLEYQNDVSTCVYRDGSKYEGQLQDGKRHGTGVYKDMSGSKYDGQWQNGKAHGLGVYEEFGICRYEGEWKEGEKHGMGTYIFANGNRYVGLWQNDMPGIDIEKPKRKNGVVTVVFRSMAMAGEDQVSRYEDDKYFPGGKEIKVVIMPPESKLGELLKQSDMFRCEHQGKAKFVLDEHGLPGGISDVEHTSEHFTNLLELCASNDVTNLTVSDYSCYSAATSRLHGAKIPDGMRIVHRAGNKAFPLMEVWGYDANGQTRCLRRWSDKNGQLHKRSKDTYEDGNWTMER